MVLETTIMRLISIAVLSRYQIASTYFVAAMDRHHFDGGGFTLRIKVVSDFSSHIFIVTSCYLILTFMMLKEITSWSKLMQCLVTAQFLLFFSSQTFRYPWVIQDLKWAVVSFAQGPEEAECSRVYSLLRSTNAVPFQVYIQQVLQPQFWVGTEFFVWVSMLYGVEVKVHYFGT